jgi:hypothetical protein
MSKAQRDGTVPGVRKSWQDRGALTASQWDRYCFRTRPTINSNCDYPSDMSDNALLSLQLLLPRRFWCMSSAVVMACATLTPVHVAEFRNITDDHRFVHFYSAFFTASMYSLAQRILSRLSGITFSRERIRCLPR